MSDQSDNDADNYNLSPQNEEEKNLPGPSTSKSKSPKRRFSRLIIPSDSSEEEEVRNDSVSSDNVSEESDAVESNDSENSSVHSSEENSTSNSGEDLPEFEPPDPGLIHVLSEVENKRRKKRKPKRKKIDDDGDVQELSIHKVNLLKFRKNRSLTKDDLEDIIETGIINDYNDFIQKGGDTGDKQTKKKRKYSDIPKYIEQDITKTPEINEDDSEFFEGKEFSIKVYVQEVPKRLKVMSSYGINCSSKAVHCIIFHYRTNELFALTTGQAWNVIHKHSDFDFPMKIAARILSQEGQIETTNKVLVGNERQNKKTMKSSQEFNARQLLEICTSFIAELREHSSILKLSCFRESRGKKGAVKLQVSLTSVRFLKRLKTSDFLSILHHMSKICRGEPTYQYTNDDKEELNTEVHQKYLTPNSREESKLLDIRLANEIRKAINREDNFATEYDFCHKHIRDFTFATEYHLYLKNVKIKTFKKCPSVSDVIEVLQRNKTVEDELLHERNKSTRAKPDNFLNAINKVKLSFVKHGATQETRKEKIINFMEGSMIDSEGRANWRVMSIWCTLRNEYLLIVHSQWLTLLTESVLPHGVPETLKELYSKKYCNKFKNKKGFVLYDLSDENFEKPFDMLKIGERKGEDVIYFTISSLNSIELSKIGTQILKTCLMIKSENVRNDKQEKKQICSLENFFNKSQTLKSKYISKYSVFVDRLNSATLVLVIPEYINKVNPLQSLIEEKELLTVMEEDELSDYLTLLNQNDFGQLALALNIRSSSKEERKQLMVAKILQVLKENDYLDENSKITSKLLVANEKSFNIDLIKTFSDLVFKNIVTHFQSFYNTLRPKLELVNLRKTLIQNDWTSFKICEIKNEPQSQ